MRKETGGGRSRGHKKGVTRAMWEVGILPFPSGGEKSNSPSPWSNEDQGGTSLLSGGERGRTVTGTGCSSRETKGREGKEPRPAHEPHNPLPTRGCRERSGADRVAGDRRTPSHESGRPARLP